MAVLLQDAQTSGGLLLASAAPDALVAELAARGVLAAVVGRVTAGEAGHIDVRPCTTRGPGSRGVTPAAAGGTVRA